MSNGTAPSFDLTAVCAGELYDIDPMDLRTDDELLGELWSDPTFLAYMEGRNAEALDHQIEHDALLHLDDAEEIF